VEIAFFVLALYGIVHVTIAAAAPARHGPLAVAAFSIPKWFFGELAPQILAVHVVAVSVFVALGAVDGPLGAVALALAVVSTVGLVVLVRRARTAAPVLAEALAAIEAPPIAPWAAPASWRILGLPLRPRGVERIADVGYVDRGHRTLSVDVYRTPGATGQPVLVQIHGGGWVLGNKRQQALPLMYRLAGRGWVCVSVQYRLSPRATWPDQLDDCRSAVDWVRGHVGEYGGDPSRVVVTGGSAGGHLSALVALLEEDVVAAVPMYGVYDWTDRFGHWNRDLEVLLARRVVKRSRTDGPDLYDRASPMSLLSDRMPPMFVVGCTSDSLVPVAEPRAFVRLAREVSRRPVLYAELPYAEHAFDILPSRRTRDTIAAIERFATWAVGPGRASDDQVRARDDQLDETTSSTSTATPTIASTPPL